MFGLWAYVFVVDSSHVQAYGEQKLMTSCVDAGVDGFIVVDLPCEAATGFRELAFVAKLVRNLVVTFSILHVCENPYYTRLGYHW